MVNSLMLLAVEANGVIALRMMKTDARRQKRASRSRTNGQRKDTCCFRSYRKSNGWCFGQ
jgi:hypothetical protein